MMKDGMPCDDGRMKHCGEHYGCSMMKPAPAASSPHADHHCPALDIMSLLRDMDTDAASAR